MDHNPYAPPKAHVVDLAPQVEAAHALEGFRDLSRLTRTLSHLLWAGMAVTAISLISAFMQLELLQRESFTDAEASANDLREQTVGSVLMVLYFITMIVFGRWIYFAHKNLPALDAQNLEYRPGWAVGSFFVPIVNFFVPYKAMTHLLRASESPKLWHVTDPPWWAQVWWLLWIVVSLLGNYTLRMSLRATTLDELTKLTIVDIVSSVLSIPLYFLARMIILRVWRHQEIASAETAGS